jgi:predicted ATP-grasp superfamily ATP-dependent carboligase
MTRVLITGVSTRAAAESAARAGFDVVAWDAFADADQHSRVDARAVPGRFTPRVVERAARHVSVDAVAYLSPFENHPAVVEALASGRRLWGNAPDVLRRVRDPRVLMNVLSRRGFVTPGNHESQLENHQWLQKPLRSGGGQGVRRATADVPVPRGCYRQPFVDGTPGSIVFVAAGGGVAPLGLSRQLVGDAAFGAAGFRYCGSIVEPFAPIVAQRAGALARAVSAAFGLVGANGVDFILRGEEPVAIEVNPRWCSSMDLIERVTGMSVLAAHARACESGELPDPPRLPATATGKAIVFSRRAVTIEDNRAWLADADVRDVPCNGERIGAGRPVCTVYASAGDGAACHAALAARSAAIQEQLEEWSPPSRAARRRTRRVA